MRKEIRNLTIEEDVLEKGHSYYIRARFMSGESEAAKILEEMINGMSMNIIPFFLPKLSKRPLSNPSYYSYNDYLGLDLDKKEEFWELTAIPIGSGLSNGSIVSMIKSIIKNRLTY